MAFLIEQSHLSPTIVTLSKAKKQMRFDDPTEPHLEDELIQVYIDAAIEKAENFINSEIKEKVYKIEGSSFTDALSFSQQKIQKVNSIVYKDENGDTQTIAEENYSLETVDRYETKIVFKEDYVLPTVQDYTVDAVTIDFTVGYAKGKVPKPIIVANMEDPP